MTTSSPLFAEWLLRGMTLSVVAAVAYLLLKPGGRARGALLAITTAGLLLLPLVLWAGPRWSLGWIALPEFAAFNPGALNGGDAAESAGGTGWMWIWVIGVTLCLIRLGIGKLALGSFRTGTLRIEFAPRLQTAVSKAAREIGIKVPPVTVSKSVGVPFVTGLLHPVIVLPDESNSWTPAVFRAVLLHEMAHIRRGDLWMQAAGNLVCALYWFNPVVWFLHRRLAGEREFLADALVIKSGTDARKYAHALLDVAASRPTVPPVPALVPSATVAIGLAGISRLEDRIRRLLGGTSGKGNRIRYCGALVMGLTAIAASACLDPFATPPTEDAARADEKDADDPLAGEVWNDEELDRRLSASPFPGE